MAIVSVTSLKGGVGKDTIVQNIGVCLAHQGYDVLIADADTNQSSLRWSGYRDPKLPPVSVVGFEDSKALSNNIPILEKKYDIVLISGTPSLNETASKIILLSDLILIPILPSPIDFWATEKFIERYELAVELKGAAIPGYFLINQFDKRTSLSKETNQILKNTTGIKSFATKLGNRVAYKDAALNGQGVYEGNNIKAKEEVIKLTNEFLKELNKIL